MSGYVIANILGGFLIATSLLVVLSKTPKQAAYLYAGQSLVLVLLFLTMAFTTGSDELFVWAGTAVVTKVILVPTIMLRAIKKIDDPNPGLRPVIPPVASIVVIAIELLICFLAVEGITLPTTAEIKPVLAVSLAHFFIGLTCVVSQRSILKQIFGYCLMENGSHVTLALLASTAPGLVEIGVATDAIFAVLVMVLVASKIFQKTKSLDANDLKSLKG